MNKFVKSLSSYLLPLLGIIFNSCIDDPVSPNGNRVKGTLYGMYDKLYVSPFDDYVISIGNAPLQTIYGSPEFSLNSFSVPYDIVLNEYYGRVMFKYEGIGINSINPVFMRPGSPDYPDWMRSYNYTIRLPSTDRIGTIYLKVISEQKFFQERYMYTRGPDDTLIYIWFTCPEENETFSGKLIYLEEEHKGGYKLDFPKYGIKSLEESVNDRIEFTESDISFDPPEITKTFRNTIPEGTYEYQSRAALNFEGYYSNSDLIIYDGVRNGSEITMPLLPLSNLKYKFTGSYQTGAYYGNAFRDIIRQPQDEINIVHKIPVSLVSPEDNAVNITGYNVFSINDDNSPGVFIYEFIVIHNFEAARFLKYYTTRRELKFSDITCRGFEKQPNSLYYWWVYKLPGFANIDSLLTVHYLKSPGYNNVELSRVRSFTTGP